VVLYSRRRETVAAKGLLFYLPVSFSSVQKLKIFVYRTIIFPTVLCGCETWLLTLREECTRKVFENRVLRRIFGPKRDEATGEWRRLHNKELYALYSSPNIIRVISQEH
jgi:hypothetical protein